MDALRAARDVIILRDMRACATAGSLSTDDDDTAKKNDLISCENCCGIRVTCANKDLTRLQIA
jgi:hypothetical protein